MEKSYTIKRFLTVLFKHKLAIGTVFLVTVLTALAGTLLMTPIFDAHSSIMIGFGREYIYTPEEGDRIPYNYYNRTGVINAEIEILASRELHEQVVNTIGIEQLYPEILTNLAATDTPLRQFRERLTNAWQRAKETVGRYFSRESLSAPMPVLASPLEQALDKFEYDLSIKGNPQSNVIRVEFQHANPEIAAECVNLLVHYFQEKHLDTFSDPKMYSFLEAKVKEYREKLDTSEKALEEFRRSHSAFSFAEQKEILLNQRGQFDQSLKETESEVAASKERLKSLTGQLEKMATSTELFYETSDRVEVIDEAKSKLLDLKLREEELRSTFTEQSPRVKSIRRQIEVVEQFLRDQENTQSAVVRRGKDQSYQEIETDIGLTRAELQGLRAKREILASKLKEIDESLLAYAATEKEMRRLELERVRHEKNLQEYIQRYEKAQVSSEMDNQLLTSIRVVSAATPPQKPFRPDLVLNMLAGIILGGFGGLGLAFLKEFLHQGMNTPDDVERFLDLPVLATISEKAS